MQKFRKMKSMLEWFKNSADKGYFGKTYMTDTWDYYGEVLGTGEAAMAFLWDTWLYQNYDSEAYDYTAEDFGLMPILWELRKRVHLKAEYHYVYSSERSKTSGRSTGTH